jgi:hypothetical protein
VTGYERGLELAGKIAAEGVAATVDPRSATPPCVLVHPPNYRDDVACGATAEWAVWCLAPATANADAWAALDVLLGAVTSSIEWDRADFMQYSLSPDAPGLAAYRVTFEEAI